MKPAFMASNWEVASRMPVTPMQWPKKDFVETAGTACGPRNFAIPLDSALSLASVPLPCALMQPISARARPESDKAAWRVR